MISGPWRLAGSISASSSITIGHTERSNVTSTPVVSSVFVGLIVRIRSSSIADHMGPIHFLP